MHVTVHTAALAGAEVPISDAAAEQVRMGFNPSTSSRVHRLKALAAAFISECDRLRSDGMGNAREAAVAATQMQGACMFAVAAATAN